MWQKGRQKQNAKAGSKPLFSKILWPMIALTMLQILILLAVLSLNGGFSYIKSFSYNTIFEKTENRKGYVESMMNQKTALVYETAGEVNALFAQMLKEERKAASALKTDRELNSRFLDQCSDELISLLRRDMVNDAFLILDSGTLYDDGDTHYFSGLYLRDTDVTENSTADNQDIFMEVGNSSLAKIHGFPLDSGWTLGLDVTDAERADFVFRPMETYADYAGTPLYNLGYWSGLSGVSDAREGSVKYSLPLATEDGEVYGVLGIGLLAKTITQNIPANDFSAGSACYILSTDRDGSGIYEPMLHTGSAYGRLVTQETVLSEAVPVGHNLYDFTVSGGTACLGSIQRINLYRSGSPYRDHRWVLVSVADKEQSLSIYSALMKTMFLSAAVTLFLCIVFAALISQRINLPVKRIVKELEESGQGLVQFSSSGIEEMDVLASAITDLQKQVAKLKDDEYTAKLEEANEALQAAYAAATSANQAKTDFLSRMSHDIRTPMNAIIGMTTIAKNHLDDREKLESCLTKIGMSSHYLLGLINDVLDMSKIEAGKFTLTLEDVNILRLTEGFLEMIGPSVREKRHELTVQIDDVAHKNVRCDSVRLQQIFMNMMSNAVKYTPPGGRIRFALSEKPCGKENVGCYAFVFEDNGRGMSPAFQEKLFEPFEREEDVRVNKEQGTGLGMSITRNIVRLMDGDIEVESEQDKGTKFTVTVFLPFVEVQEGEAEQEKDVSAEEAMRGERFAGHRILVAEDNELNREIAAEIFAMAGLSVEMAENGREAVEKFKASAPGAFEMIFMDIQMPEMNGYEAAGEIRALPREDAESIPIVAMTANAFAEDIRDARAAGMNDHVAKPLELDKLFSTMARYL
ncbi:MAG: ATP-binding protein [bacterium]|nr:ATP-binding protein [bacterium]